MNQWQNIPKELSEKGCDLESVCKAIAFNENNYGINKEQNMGFATCMPDGFNTFMVEVDFECVFGPPILTIYSYEKDDNDINLAFLLGCLKHIIPEEFTLSSDDRNVEIKRCDRIKNPENLG